MGAPATPARFDEAVEWFRSRVPVTDKRWRKMQQRARDHAFKVAGLAQLDQVVDVWEALDAAIAKGETLEDFKRRVESQLRDAWGRRVPDPAWRLETIFRTNVQRAYNAGRVTQLRDPPVQKARPYWMLDALLDSRTTDVCRSLNRTILPADHAFWHTHIPPLHFNCRSSIRGLTPEQARRRGIAEGAPRVPAQEGFGGDPLAPWTPDLGKKPAPLVKLYRKRQ